GQPNGQSRSTSQLWTISKSIIYSIIKNFYGSRSSKVNQKNMVKHQHDEVSIIAPGNKAPLAIDSKKRLNDSAGLKPAAALSELGGKALANLKPFGMPDGSQCFQTFCLVQNVFARHNGHWFPALKIASLMEGDVRMTFTTYFSSSEMVSTVSFAAASCLFTVYVSSLATICRNKQ
ncbi:hypothetical protein AGLY_013736, partial [Aphis glycines]